MCTVEPATIGFGLTARFDKERAPAGAVCAFAFAAARNIAKIAAMHIYFVFIHSPYFILKYQKPEKEHHYCECCH